MHSTRHGSLHIKRHRACRDCSHLTTTQLRIEKFVIANMWTKLQRKNRNLLMIRVNSISTVSLQLFVIVWPSTIRYVFMLFSNVLLAFIQPAFNVFRSITIRPISLKPVNIVWVWYHLGLLLSGVANHWRIYGEATGPCPGWCQFSRACSTVRSRELVVVYGSRALSDVETTVRRSVKLWLLSGPINTSTSSSTECLSSQASATTTGDHLEEAETTTSDRAFGTSSPTKQDGHHVSARCRQPSRLYVPASSRTWDLAQLWATHGRALCELGSLYSRLPWKSRKSSGKQSRRAHFRLSSARFGPSCGTTLHSIRALLSTKQLPQSTAEWEIH